MGFFEVAPLGQDQDHLALVAQCLGGGFRGGDADAFRQQRGLRRGCGKLRAINHRPRNGDDGDNQDDDDVGFAHVGERGEGHRCLRSR